MCRAEVHQENHRRKPETDIATELDGLTDRIIAYRIVRRMGIMPLIEIKGLKETIAGVKGGIADIRTVAADVNQEASDLKIELSEVRDQIRQHRADLRFEAETLGNGSDAASSQSTGSGASTEPVNISGA